MQAPARNKNWELIFEDPLDETKTVLNISNLTVNNKPLRGIPDLVFREKKTGNILIVERKASNKEVPYDGWPNLKAQLWAYGKIDQWADAPNVLLVGEIWGFNSEKVFPRAVIKWSKNNEIFEKNNSDLFNIYRGL